MWGEGHDAWGTFSRWIGLCALISQLGCSVYDPALISNSNASIPEQPAASTSSLDDSTSVAFALKDVYIRQSAEMAARTGIDLDATTTTGRENATCEPFTQDGMVVGQAVVDGVKGIDNALGASLLPTTQSSLPCLEDNIALAQGSGVGTIILWVRDWNGKPNDASVTAMLTTAVDGTSEDPSLVTFEEDDRVNLVYSGTQGMVSAPNPAWEGNDSWFIDPLDFDSAPSGEPSPDLPKVPQLGAYVAAGRLVVPLVDDTAFKLIAGDGVIASDGAMDVVVNGGFMIGDISADHSRLENGLFAGRFSIEELAKATLKIGMCDINASVIQSLFGQFADIQKSPEQDDTGAECDAFSLGVTFTGTAGRIAGLASGSRPQLEPCADEEPVEVDQCCPSVWLAGKSRLETCQGTDKVVKAARFDSLPDAIQVPVPEPAPLF